MGIFLSTPVKDKHTEEGIDSTGTLQWGASAMQGWRRNMEDAHIAHVALQQEGGDTAQHNASALFGVFDGHGGLEVAQFCAAHMKEELVALPEYKAGDYTAALRRVFHRMDELLLTKPDVQTELEGYRRGGAESAGGDASQSQAKKPRTRRSVSEGEDAGASGGGGSGGGGGGSGSGGGGGSGRGGEKRTISTSEAIDWFQKLLDLSKEFEAERSGAKDARSAAAAAPPPAPPSEAQILALTENDSAAPGKAEGSAEAASEALSETVNGSAPTGPERSADFAASDAMVVVEEDGEASNGSGGNGNHGVGNGNGNGSASAGSSGSSGGGSSSISKSLIVSNSGTQDSSLSGSSNGGGGSRGTADVRALLRLSNTLNEPQCTLADHPVPSGCTSVVALLAGDKLYVANAGDSRAIVCRGGTAIALSEDHKPKQEREMRRIQEAGGFVTAAGRVNGNLNLSRSIGDLKYKQNRALPPERQIITAEPDVTCYSLTPEDEFFVLACDGIWDCMTTEEVAAFVREGLREMTPAQVAEAVFDRCLADDPHQAAGLGGDNMSMIIVRLALRDNAGN